MMGWGGMAKRLGKAAPGMTERVGKWGGGLARAGERGMGVNEFGARRMMTGGAVGLGLMTMSRSRSGKSSGAGGLQPHSMGGTTMGGPGAGMGPPF